jgi:hypothetical protein
MFYVVVNLQQFEEDSETENVCFFERAVMCTSPASGPQIMTIP